MVKNKILASLSVFMLIAVMLSAFVPAAYATTAEEDWYSGAVDGELLYTVDFAGDKYFKPEVIAGTPNMVVDPTDSKKVTVNSSTDKKASWWGGYVTCLPLNETTNYTIYFSATRPERAAFGFYIDCVSICAYGAYGYLEQMRIMQGTASLPGHGYVKYEEKNYTVPGYGEPQEYAFEVCGVNQTFAFYIKTANGIYELVDESAPGEATFYNDHLGIFLYAYYSAMFTDISDMRIHRGLAFGDPTPITTEAPETTKAPETTRKPETTKKPETSKAPETTVEVTEAPVESDAVTTSAPEQKKGCGSSVAVPALAAVILGGAVVFTRRKKRF